MTYQKGFYDHLYNSSQKINLNDYFQEYASLKKNFYSGEQPRTQKSILETMGVTIDEEELIMLKEYCSIDNLTVPDEVEVSRHHRSLYKEIIEGSSIPAGIPLQTLKDLKNTAKYTKATWRATKYRSEISIKYDDADKSDQQIASPGEEVLVYIRVYAPFKHRSYNKSSAQLIKVSLSNMLVILGSQTLADVRDKISCLCDLSIATDVSKKPVLKAGPSAKEVYKSGFFFIEGTFYNDMRGPENKDNSLVIREWATARNIGSFDTALMEETRIDSLKVKFGFPWVYQHQGNCEHLIVFGDARLLNLNDDLAVSSYPRIHRIKPYINRYCMTCGIFSVRWITTDNERLPHDPCFFCESCFKSYNYIQGEKIGSFSAYPYPFHAELIERGIKNNKTNDSAKK
ncbi:snRNA-activating protein complex subunit 3 [Leptopilina boulardi]|uniref:snRNA-activating protein complex subunit 3 n=1 Tax=Leptopilina boulardi TaxID=63433 RepID=UPI0021F59017|nr:snRNA-activating protein complex subunit 3 [Leptopilina boulardi]